MLLLFCIIHWLDIYRTKIPVFSLFYNSVLQCTTGGKIHALPLYDVAYWVLTSGVINDFSLLEYWWIFDLSHIMDILLILYKIIIHEKYYFGRRYVALYFMKLKACDCIVVKVEYFQGLGCMQIICKFEVAGKIVKWFLEEWIYYYPRDVIFVESYMCYFQLIDLISMLWF